MGEAADRKVTEIEESRRGLEADLRELEGRLPASLRSTKALAGLLLGSAAFTAFVLRRVRSKPREGRPTAEVVVRIVREDVGT
ncbi:MAG TPA: hypothetical protein VIE12_08210 [Actinomycetota bacterium]|jgi:hypothetical protein